jgi:hypothetical protein
MFDHDRINELQAALAGAQRALAELLAAVDLLAHDHPAAAERVTSARRALQAADLLARDARVAGQTRWADAPEHDKRPDPMH